MSAPLPPNTGGQPFPDPTAAPAVGSPEATADRTQVVRPGQNPATPAGGTQSADQTQVVPGGGSSATPVSPPVGMPVAAPYGAQPGQQWGQPDHSGGQAPGWGQPGAAQAGVGQPGAPQWGQPQAPQPQAQQQWGQAAAPEQQWGQPAPDQQQWGQQPPSGQQWGQPQQQMSPPPAPQWGQQPQAPQPQQWGQPATPEPQAQQQWGQPVAMPGQQQWGQQPAAAGQYAGQPPGQFAAPGAYGQPQAGYGFPPAGGQPGVAIPTGVLASWGSRFAAYLIDGLVAALPAILFAIVGVAIETPMLVILGYLLSFALSVYNLGYRQGTTGQSIGKGVMKIMVVGMETRQVLGFGGSFLRMLCGIVNSIACGLPIGWLAPLWDEQYRQTWSDKIMKTQVFEAHQA